MRSLSSRGSSRERPRPPLADSTHLGPKECFTTHGLRTFGDKEVLRADGLLQLHLQRAEDDRAQVIPTCGQHQVDDLLRREKTLQALEHRVIA